MHLCLTPLPEQHSVFTPASQPPPPVHGPGTFLVDYGVELAAWVEVQSDDLSPATAAACVRISVSEMAVPQEFTYDSPPWKTVAPTAYAGGWFRAEFNPQLYEGVRRGFFHVLPNCTQHLAAAPFTLSHMRAVAQIKPVNWNGSFSAPDDVQVRAWYAGAYTVKLNLLADGFGSILDDRGDRVAIAGDAHPTQAAAMAAFGIYPFIRQSLLATVSKAFNYFSYNLFWILSMHDYYRKTGDAALVKQLTPDIMTKLDTLRNRTNGNLPRGPAGFIGWDDRLDGLKFVDALPENQYAFTAIYVQAAKAAAAMLHAAGDAGNATHAAAWAADVQAKARAAPTWWRAWGLHALAHAVMANMTTAEERPAIFAARFTNATQICSYSNFNQYYILQALGDMHQPAAAMDSIRLCWGETELALGATTVWEVSGYGGQWGKALAPFQDGVGGNSPPVVPAHSGGATSLAHPWSAGVTAWLSDTALGLRPAEPGYAVLRAAPLMPVVSGAVPLPGADGGVAAASFDAVRGRHVLAWGRGVRRALVRLPVRCALDEEAEVRAWTAPWDGVWHGNDEDSGADARADAQADVGADGGGWGNATAMRAVGATRAALPWATGGAGLFDHAVELTLDGEGPVRHVLHVGCRPQGGQARGLAAAAAATAAAAGAAAARSGTAHLATTAPRVYADFDWMAPQVARDNTTRGDWVGRYGSRGYMLLGDCANVHGGTALPAGVNATYSFLKPGCWTSNATGSAKEASALAPPPGSPADAPRTLGALMTSGMLSGTLDLAFVSEAAGPGGAAAAATPCFNISFYFCDWDGTRSVDNGGGTQLQRRVSFDLFALPAHDVAWATTVVAETGAFPSGEYVTFDVCDARLAAGVRFRIYLITGDNAPLSGVFFD